MTEVMYMYAPSSWTEDGLIVSWVARTVEVSKRMARVGTWAVVAGYTAIAIGTASPAGELSFLTPANMVSEVAVQGQVVAKALAPDQLLVPDGYWTRLGSAMRSVSLLPGQALSQDPPMIV